jgi:sugar transferase EpsL
MKRLFDIFFAILLLLFLSPLLFIVALFIRIKLGSPVVFAQSRPGLSGCLFKMYKFRSMTNELDQQGNLLPDELRLTAFGKALRASSFDELPELFNIIKGDMSFVGPRPLLPEYLPLYTSTQARRHEVKPGITGWAQVNGRNAISWEDKFKLDVWYVDNCSMILDLKIMFLTFIKVIKKDGVSAKDHVTMPKFEGTKNEK